MKAESELYAYTYFLVCPYINWLSLPWKLLKFKPPNEVHRADHLSRSAPEPIIRRLQVKDLPESCVLDEYPGISAFRWS
jgi:hypothetical protein